MNNDDKGRMSRKDAKNDTAALAPIQFLFDTLVKKTVLRSRNGIVYFTLRAWRQPIKEYQIRAIEAVKAHDPATLGEVVAPEIIEAATAIWGKGAFKYVVPMPCGHSRRSDCLSFAIANVVARRSGVPLLCAFANQNLIGKSSPKTNADRPRLVLLKPPDAPVLLIDDIASSGSHVEEAVHQMRPTCGTVYPIVWIGNSSGRDTK